MADAGKVAIVTGAARGIGLAIAWRFAKAGMAVVAADLDLQGAELTAAELRASGHRALAVQVDVSSRVSADAMVERALAEFGRIDVLVNNAGIAGRAAPLTEVTDGDWDTMMAVNLKSVYL